MIRYLLIATACLIPILTVINVLPSYSSVFSVPLFLAFLFLKWKEGKSETPKGLDQSIEIARKFISKVLYGENKPITLDVLEASRHKDLAYGTKKGLLHKIIVRLKDGKCYTIIDDPFIFKNPHSVTHFSVSSGYVPKVVKSSAELERELRPVPRIVEYPKAKYKKKVKIEKKEEVK